MRLQKHLALAQPRFERFTSALGDAATARECRVQPATPAAAQQPMGDDDAGGPETAERRAELLAKLEQLYAQVIALETKGLEPEPEAEPQSKPKRKHRSNTRASARSGRQLGPPQLEAQKEETEETEGDGGTGPQLSEEEAAQLAACVRGLSGWREHFREVGDGWGALHVEREYAGMLRRLTAHTQAQLAQKKKAVEALRGRLRAAQVRGGCSRLRTHTGGALPTNHPADAHTHSSHTHAPPLKCAWLLPLGAPGTTPA
jgi:hypothetical protein